MTKTLTEQWREGTLPDGFYYIKKNKFGIIKGIKTEELFCGEFCTTPNDFIEEVLAPVPSYDEYKQLVSNSDELILCLQKMVEDECSRRCELETKCSQLEKRLEVSEKAHYRTLEQLRIATGALRETKEKLLHVELSGLDGDNRQKMYDLMFEDGVIDKALKEMEGVK